MTFERIHTYERLAAEQHFAAITGGVTWRKFVARAERETQIPWRILRDILEPYCKAFYASRDAHNTGSEPK